VDGFRRTAGKEHPQTIAALMGHSQNLERLGRPEEGESLLREVLENTTRQHGLNHPNTARALLLVGQNLLKREKLSDAEKELLQAWKIVESSEGMANSHRQELVQALIELYKVWHSKQPEEGYSEKVKQWQEILER
jgi:hypothetical protein